MCFIWSLQSAELEKVTSTEDVKHKKGDTVSSVILVLKIFLAYRSHVIRHLI